MLHDINHILNKRELEESKIYFVHAPWNFRTSLEIDFTTEIQENKEACNCRIWESFQSVLTNFSGLSEL